MYGFKLVWALTFLASGVIECFSISVFTSLVSIPIGITSSAIGFKIYAVTAGIKEYKSIINRTW